MASNGVSLDKDLSDMSDYMYQSLVKQFGKAEADKIFNEEDAELDSETMSLINNAGTLLD